MTLSPSYFETAIAALRAAGVDAPRREARLLLAKALGLNGEDILRLDEWPPLPPKGFLADIAARAKGTPLSRICGKRWFYNHEFMISDDVLDPRADTEILVEAALAIAHQNGLPATLVDLGTGTGAIIISLMAAWQDLGVKLPPAFGLDISQAALAIARQNASNILGKDAPLDFIEASWDTPALIAPLTSHAPFAMILSNPPYIESGQIDGLDVNVKDHDPHLALDGGADGLSAYRAIAALLGDHLAIGGHLLLEIGQGQQDDVTAICLAALPSLVALPPKTDLAGIVRILIFKRLS